MPHCLAAGILSDHLRSIRSALTGALKAHLTCAGPSNNVSTLIGDGDFRIIKGREDISNASRDILRSFCLDDLDRFNAGIQINSSLLSVVLHD